MTNKMYGAFLASLSAVALMFGASEAFARSGGGHGGGIGSAHAAPHSVGRSLARHRGRIGGVWPGGLYGPSYDEPLAEVPAQPLSGDIHYTYTYDVPWDWAHRYPPNVVPSDRPYVSSCPAETVTVPGAGGRQQTVNITRCY